jgi:hypothetical protein
VHAAASSPDAFGSPGSGARSGVAMLAALVAALFEALVAPGGGPKTAASAEPCGVLGSKTSFSKVLIGGVGGGGELFSCMASA